MENREQRIQRLRAKAMKLPLLPGVYIMHDSTGKIIYIGKALSLIHILEKPILLWPGSAPLPSAG